jgi:hypothetical protein
MNGAVIVAQLIGDDTAQAGDIVVRSRSPVFALCRALLAAGANPNSRLECFRGSVLALTVKSVGIGAKLTIKENDWVGPKVVPYEPFSRDRVERYVRQNGKHIHARREDVAVIATRIVCFRPRKLADRACPTRSQPVVDLARGRRPPESLVCTPSMQRQAKAKRGATHDGHPQGAVGEVRLTETAKETEK